MDFNVLITNFLNWIVQNGITFLVGIIVLLVGWRLVNHFVKVITSLMRKRSLDETLVVFLDALISTAFRAILILLVMGIVGLDTASLAALFASAGLAIGLAMQGSLSNFAGGVIILFIRPFKVGDFIKNGDISGNVEAIKMFYTELVTVDNKVVFIPNGSLANGTIVNYTMKPTRRLEFVFGISYQTDITQAKQVIEQVLTKHRNILDNPAPFIGVSQHADSSVQLIVWGWCETEVYWPTHYAIIEEVKLAFDAAHIEIPFPQLDVHMKNLS